MVSGIRGLPDPPTNDCDCDRWAWGLAPACLRDRRRRERETEYYLKVMKRSMDLVGDCVGAN